MKTALILFFAMSSAAFAQQEVGTRLGSISKSRVDLEAVMDNKPYKAEEHKAIKSYFTALESLNQDLSTYPKYKKNFNSKVRALGVEVVCKEIILEKTQWNELVNNCTKNGFFLCAEDVKQYIDLRKNLSKQLDADLKTTFDQTPQCQ